MLTIAQIYAVLALLLAFNVPQSTVDNVQAILQNTTSIVQSVPMDTPINTGGGTESVVTPTTPLNVYTLKYEDSLQDYYYAGDKEIATSTVDGINAIISTSKYLPNDCINIWEGSEFKEKVCGYYVARIQATQGQKITLIATDGSTYSQ